MQLFFMKNCYVYGLFAALLESRDRFYLCCAANFAHRADNTHELADMLVQAFLLLLGVRDLGLDLFFTRPPRNVDYSSNALLRLWDN